MAARLGIPSNAHQHVGARAGCACSTIDPEAIRWPFHYSQLATKQCRCCQRASRYALGSLSRRLLFRTSQGLLGCCSEQADVVQYKTATWSKIVEPQACSPALRVTFPHAPQQHVAAVRPRQPQVCGITRCGNAVHRSAWFKRLKLQQHQKSLHLDNQPQRYFTLSQE